MAVELEVVAKEVRGWLRHNVVGERQIPDDYGLIDEGLLTSLQTVELVLFLEEKFGVSIDEDEVSEDNFRSISAIAALVSSKKGSGDGAA